MTAEGIELMKSRRHQILLLSALLTFQLVVRTSPSSLRPQIKPEVLYKAALPSIMTLTVTKSDGKSFQGSAFMLTDSGIAATAWHLVDGAKEASVRFSDGEEFEVSGLVDKDEKRDLALIRVKAFGRPQLKTNTSNPEVGSRAFVIGAPRGLEFTISEGLVSQLQQIEGMKQYQFSSPASPGNSGGPLLNEAGEVIGVVSWQLTNGQNLNFAIPSTYLLGLDQSLPTTPWTAVRTSARIGNNPVTSVAVTDAKADELLGRTFWAVLDAFSAVNYQIRLEAHKGTLSLGVDSWLYSAQRELNLLTDQTQRTLMEGEREAFKEELLTAVKSVQEAMKYVVDSIQMAQQSGGWNSTALDLYNRGSAANSWVGGKITKLEETSIWKSDSFQMVLPSVYKAPRKPRPLGVTVYLSRPRIIVDVTPQGLADKLGLKSLDILPLPVREFEEYLGKSAGKRVQITINRLGQQVKLNRDIPKTFMPDPVSTSK